MCESAGVFLSQGVGGAQHALAHRVQGQLAGVEIPAEVVQAPGGYGRGLQDGRAHCLRLGVRGLGDPWGQAPGVLREAVVSGGGTGRRPPGRAPASGE